MLKYPLHVILDQLCDCRDHDHFQSTDTGKDLLYPSIILIVGSVLLFQAFHSKKPSSRHQETAQLVQTDSISQRITTPPKAVQLEMDTMRQRLYSPIESNIDFISFDHSLPRRDVVVGPDAIKFQDIMKVDIQCIGWHNNSCWWDAPSEAIYWTIRNDISTALELSLEIVNRSATDSFSDYLHKRCQAEPRAEEDWLWFREQLMGWRDQVLDVFEREKIIARQGAFQSSSVSTHRRRLLRLNHN